MKPGYTGVALGVPNPEVSELIARPERAVTLLISPRVTFTDRRNAYPLYGRDASMRRRQKGRAEGIAKRPWDVDMCCVSWGIWRSCALLGWAR